MEKRALGPPAIEKSPNKGEIIMVYREYGKTGKKVSLIGFGGMRFRPEDYKKGDFNACADIMLRAQELGINYFDTAPYYCSDKSEEIFGHAFSQMKPGFYCTTKNSTINTGDKTADDFRRRLERSLTRMRVPKINFMHIWCVMSYDDYAPMVAPGMLYDGALRAKEEGLIDHIVVSAHASGADIRRILEEGLFEGVLLGYNATNFAYRAEGLRAARELNLGIATMNPLGGGVIAQNPDFYSFLRTDPSFDVPQSAIRFNASHPEISTVLCGISSLSDLESCVAAIDGLEVMDDEKRNKIASRLQEGLDTLCTGCGYCDGCPASINIPRYMDCYNQYLITGERHAIKSRMSNHWDIDQKGAGNCIACGYCESRCTQKLPIIDRLKEISEL